jgi:hypothetical protein
MRLSCHSGPGRLSESAQSGAGDQPGPALSRPRGREHRGRKHRSQPPCPGGLARRAAAWLDMLMFQSTSSNRRRLGLGRPYDGVASLRDQFGSP